MVLLKALYEDEMEGGSIGCDVINVKLAQSSTSNNGYGSRNEEKTKRYSDVSVKSVTLT